MRILYCNPIFFEYRLPFYKELVRLFEKNFYVMYSPVRYKMCRKEAFCRQIKVELGDNAVPFTKDHLFDTNSMKWDVMPDIEKGKRIPVTYGLMRAIHKVKPDVLITEGYFQWSPLVLLYGLLHHVPVYMGYERTLHTERNTGRLKTMQRKLFNRLFAGFLVNGQETQRYLESLGVPSYKIHIGGMSADSEGLRKSIDAFRHSEDFDSFKRDYHRMEGLMYLFSGQIAERKGVKYLLSAWMKHIENYPDDTLVLIGDGNKYRELKEQYSNVQSIVMKGRVDYADIHKYYAVADVFILPTIEDNWSLVVPEAMACGLPVATSIYNGCHVELVHKDENGITFDPYKEETLINALDYFHHHNLKTMGQKSIELEREFNTENCARRVYEALTAKQK